MLSWAWIKSHARRPTRDHLTSSSLSCSNLRTWAIEYGISWPLHEVRHDQACSYIHCYDWPKVFRWPCQKGLRGPCEALQHVISTSSFWLSKYKLERQARKKAEQRGFQPRKHAISNAVPNCSKVETFELTDVVQECPRDPAISDQVYSFQ